VHRVYVLLEFPPILLRAAPEPLDIADAGYRHNYRYRDHRLGDHRFAARFREGSDRNRGAVVRAGWLDSEEMQVWFGRIFLFAVIVSLGALVSWGLSKLVRVSLLAGMDRFLGSVFGLARAVLLVGLAVLAGQYTGFDNDEWWLDSTLIPHFEVVASWINVMAPQGYDLLTPDEPAEVLPVRMPDALIFSGD
jgi:hypothetical protein